jgi:hypothetical protein
MATLNANEINDGDIFFERKIRDVTEGLDPAYFNWLYNKIAFCLPCHLLKHLVHRLC